MHETNPPSALGHGRSLQDDRRPPQYPTCPPCPCLAFSPHRFHEACLSTWPLPCRRAREGFWRALLPGRYCRINATATGSTREGTHGVYPKIRLWGDRHEPLRLRMSVIERFLGTEQSTQRTAALNGTRCHAIAGSSLREIHQGFRQPDLSEHLIPRRRPLAGSVE
jgi:hypothetical protein